MTEQELAYKIAAATGLLCKRIDMLRHGMSIQESDLVDIKNLLMDAKQYFYQTDDGGKSNDSGGRLDRGHQP